MMSTIQSSDGTTIGYSVQGNGPGLLIIHGAFRASEHYQRLAEALCGDFTVYVMNRRGRNESGPLDDYSMQKAAEDAIAILEKHDIPFLFGHSFGAVAALHVASLYRLEKLCVYEPPLLSRMDLRWYPRFKSLLDQNDFISASVVFIKGMKMGGIMNAIPNFILKALFRKMAHGEEWDANCKLLKTVPADFSAAMKEPATFDSFEAIHTPTLILGGTKTPNYLKEAIEELAGKLRNSKTVMLKGLNHNAPDEGDPVAVAAEILKFLTA